MKKVMYEIAGLPQVAYCQTENDVAGYVAAYPNAVVSNLTADEQEQFAAYIAANTTTA